MKKQIIHTQDYTNLGMPGAGGIAAACIRAGNYVYVTGQTAFTLDGELVGVGDPAAQARQAMENIKFLMEKAGGSLADVVKITRAVEDDSWLAGRSQECGQGVLEATVAIEAAAQANPRAPVGQRHHVQPEAAAQFALR